MKKILQEQFDKLSPVAGVRLGCAAAGVKYKNRDDLLLIEICKGASVAAVFTRNAFCAAPVTVAKDHLSSSEPRYLLINAGNANAGTGDRGMEDALTCCLEVAKLTDDAKESVLPFSTGVIGEHLPVEKITSALPAAIDDLSEDNWRKAAKAIMTTDTLPKGISLSKTVSGHEITVTGIIKGAGMVCPDMATMLAYVATNAGMSSQLLQQCLRDAVYRSMNRITVDGDTSTNDACVLIATGQPSLPQIQSADSEAYHIVAEMIVEACEFLASAVVRDGEGATKFVEVSVSGGNNENECRQVAYTIAHSPLVKTALFASDPNWGRILAAVGRAGVRDLDIKSVRIFINDVCIVSDGGRDRNYSETQGQRVMASPEIVIGVELNRGNAFFNVWTCDFSYDYVKINAEYRT